MKKLRCITLVLAFLALVPATKVLAEWGERFCSDCAEGESSALVTGWVEGVYGTQHYVRDFERSDCMTAEDDCALWCSGGTTEGCGEGET